MQFIPGVKPAILGQPAYWLAFSGDRLLISPVHGTIAIPKSMDLPTLGIHPVRSQYLGTLNNIPVYSAELPDPFTVPQGIELWGLRKLFGALEEEMFSLAGLARQIVEWDKTHQFCGQCGSHTANHPVDRAKICPHCDLVSYPRISPAIIVAVTRGREILLARGKRFAVPMYSVLAGFVEPGETLEDCVRREVKEEVGIEIKNIAYFGSQPWPFPSGLMIGFTAEYASGEINVDPAEIVDAGWFKADNLPMIPEKLSIARKLIDRYLAEASQPANSGT